MIEDPVSIRDRYRRGLVDMKVIVDSGDLSAITTSGDSLRKALLLACASYYENQITGIVTLTLRKNVAAGCRIEPWLVECSVVEKFFRWFNFRNDNNTNGFFSHFGGQFKTKMRLLIQEREYRKESERSFLDLCTKRNECVHRNFVAYSLDYTLEDIYRKHRMAMGYVRLVEFGFKKWLAVDGEDLGAPRAV